MTSDLLRELGESRRPETDEPSAQVRQRLMSAMQANDGQRMQPTRTRPAPPVTGLRLAWRLGGLGAAAAALAAALLIAPDLPTAGNAPPEAGVDRGEVAAAPAAVNVGSLLKLAAQHSAATPLVGRPEQFVFTETLSTYGGLGGVSRARNGSTDTYTYTKVAAGPPELRYRWQSVDGTRDGLELPAGQYPSNMSINAVPGCRRGNVNGPLDRPGIRLPCVPYAGFVPELPTTPTAMHAYLYRPTTSDDPEVDQHTPADQLAFSRIAEVIYVSRPLPAVQAALFEAASRIPGLTVDPSATDVSGRSGVALVRTDRGVRIELIFDTTTHEYLGMNEVVVQDNAVPYEVAPMLRFHAGEILAREAVLRVALVDRSGQLP